MFPTGDQCFETALDFTPFMVLYTSTISKGGPCETSAFGFVADIMH